MNDGNDVYHNVKISESPKMALEVMIFEIIEGTPQRWNVGDILDFGFKKWADTIAYPLKGTGYWFRIECMGEGVFYVYAMWADDNYNETKKYITTIESNLKYRYEIITDAELRLVRFDVWDVELNPEMPYSAVRTNAELSQEVRPFHICLQANHNDEYVAQAYLYRLKVEYKRVGIRLGTGAR
jgi:hypothetical protein